MIRNLAAALRKIKANGSCHDILTRRACARRVSLFVTPFL
jgi:hypothetical protein